MPSVVEGSVVSLIGPHPPGVPENAPNWFVVLAVTEGGFRVQHLACRRIVTVPGSSLSRFTVRTPRFVVGNLVVPAPHCGGMLKHKGLPLAKTMTGEYRGMTVIRISPQLSGTDIVFRLHFDGCRKAFHETCFQLASATAQPRWRKL